MWLVVPYHWGQNSYIPFFLFGGIIFGDYYRKPIFLGGINYRNVMIGVLGRNEYFSYSYSFSLQAMWELITLMRPPFPLQFWSFEDIVCTSFVPNGTEILSALLSYKAGGGEGQVTLQKGSGHIWGWAPIYSSSLLQHYALLLVELDLFTTHLHLSDTCA